MSDVERRLKVATVVDTIDEAFAFVVNTLDNERLDRADIAITPVTYIGDEGEDVERYEVSVEGTVT